MPRQWGIIVSCFVLAGLFSMPSTAWPADPVSPATGQTVVTVIGTGRIEGDNVDAARNEAISNSLVAAIEKASETILPKDFRVEHFATLNQTLYNQPGKFILGYKVLTEAPSKPSYRVMVEATISMDTLRQVLADAQLLPGEKSFPRVLLLIAEQNLEDTAPHFWWGQGTAFLESACENRLAAALKDQGLIIIDHTTSPPSSSGETTTPVVLPKGPTPSDAEALALGKLYGADMVVVGMASAKSAGNVMGGTYQSFKGEFTGRALLTKTGETVCNVTRSAVAMETDPVKGGRQALRDVGMLAAEALAPQLIAAWQATSNGAIAVSMVVQGTGKLGNFVKFRNSLQDLPMVTGVETTEIQPDAVTLSLQVKGGTQVLADAIMLRDFDTFGIHISQISRDTISLSLVPK